MVSVVAGPEQVLDAGNGATAVFGNVPLVFREIFSDFIQELVVIDGFIPHHEFDLFFLLDDSEVFPVFELERLVFAESLECFVPLRFLQRGELEQPLGHDQTLEVDLMHHIRQSIQFSYILGRYHNIFVNDHRARTCHFNEDFVVLAREVGLHLVELGRVLHVRLGQRCENVVLGGTPVELLHGEAVHPLARVERVHNEVVLDRAFIFKCYSHTMLPMIFPKK